jgi:rhodanese-related sulfurtransferase
MKKILLMSFLLSLSLYAKVINASVSQEILDSKIPIVDIRTPQEWKETGLLKGSIPIMFFDEKGNYDLKLFLAQLNKAVDTTKEFAIICRTGSRTRILANFLSMKMNYTVTNLQNGIVFAKYKKLPIMPYKK